MPNKFNITVFIISNVNHIKEKTKGMVCFTYSINIIKLVLYEMKLFFGDVASW